MALPTKMVGQWSGSTEELGLSRTFTGQNSPIRSLTYMPDMKQVISGSQDGSIMIWNFKPQHRAYRLRGHTGPVLSLDAAANEEIFASGSGDHTVRLWKPSIRGPYKSFKAHIGGVCSVKFSEDSKLLVTSSTDKMVKLWDVSTLSKARPKFLWCVHGHRNWVRSADISKWSLNVCSGGDDRFVKVWDTKTSSMIASFEGHMGNVHSAQFDPLTGVCVASAGEDGCINLWDVRAKNAVQHYSLQQKSTLTSIRFHPSGNYLLSTSEDKLVRVWDLREGRLVFAIQGHSKGVSCVDVSSDGSHFVTGSADQTVLAWKCGSLSGETEEKLEELAPETSSLQSFELNDKFEGRKKRSHSKHQKKERRDSSRSQQGERRGSRRTKSLDGDENDGDDQRTHRHRVHGHHRSSKIDKHREHRHKSKQRSRSSSKSRRVSSILSDTSDTRPIQKSSTASFRSKSLRHSSVGELRRKHDVYGEEQKAISSTVKNEEAIASNDDDVSDENLGHFTMAAIKASYRYKSQGEGQPEENSVKRRESTHASSTIPNEAIHGLARAMQNLEQRLRMNEDAMADLRLDQSNLSRSIGNSSSN